MTLFYFLGHGPTEWNAQKRLQGRTDIPLSEAGIEQVSGRLLPKDKQALRWFSSPLQRARQTAELLDINAASELALIEMNWGEWEGQTLGEIRQTQAELLAKQETRGLQLTPPGGETPAQVAERVTDWAEHLSLADADSEFGCVCHKGVIRSIYAAASGWDMLGKPPHKLDFQSLQCFRWYGERWRIEQLNIPLLSV